MHNTRIHKQLLDTYLYSLTKLSEGMNLPADNMSIFEAGQLFLMLKQDCERLSKRIEYLKLGDTGNLIP